MSDTKKPNNTSLPTDPTGIMTLDNDTLTVERQKVKDQEACLIVIRGNPQGKRYEILKPAMSMGRDVTADIIINDPNVSRNHAEVIKDGNDIKLKDNNSTNGTYVNNKKLTEAVVLKKEDMIKLGNTILKYLPRGELETFYIGNLESQAHTDSLTKVFNKGHIMDALNAEFNRAKALNQDFSILIFDLDHFKKINDTPGLGHDAGDYVLKETCNILRTQVFQKNHLVGRFGGEEFIVLMPNTALDAAYGLAESIRSTIAGHSFLYDNKKISVTTSVGVAEMTFEVDNATDLFKLADKAVYAAKTAGRNRVCKA